MNKQKKGTLFFNNVSDLIKWVESQKRFSKKTSLKNMEYFAKIFGNPEKKITTIHVTGTNGKGSTVSYLKNIYLKAGYNVATFTSPYIVCFNERITYNGQNISDENLLKYGNLILSKYPVILEELKELPTFFEFITLLALLYFSDIEDLDLAIMEVGIGGRLDSTNIITPLLGVITNVTFDHMEQLGSTLDAITKEKLGIIKNNIPLITGSKNPLLISQMESHCKNVNSNFLKVDYERLKIKKIGLDQSTFSYKGYDNLVIQMTGLHQIENACLTVEVVEFCNNLFEKRKSNLYVSNEILYEGLISSMWPGRLELISKEPLIYIDGGHNIDCIERVCEFVDTLNYNHKRVVVAISNDKDKDAMIKRLDKSFDELIFTHYTYSRSATSDDLYLLSNKDNKLIIDSIDDTINYCFNNKCDLTLFIGSLYLISEIRPKLFNYKKN